MNLSRADRRERLASLAAEYALGTSPPRVRRRLARIARRDPVVAEALAQWERLIAVLGEGAPGVTPPPRVWRRITEKLGLVTAEAPRIAWWDRLGLWRGLAAASFVVAMALGVVQLTRQPVPAAAPLVVVLAGPDARPAIIATAARSGRFLTMKAVVDTAPPQGKAFELWALPRAGAPRSLGVIPDGAIVEVPLQAPAGESLANITPLSVSLEPAGGSPTGAPTGPVLYSGKIERMY
ncbi:MAG: anti-sigma factor [Betaproteobacteria bacterium]|nr:anti-sigma factor [Betaproteobacteria bacterium]